MDPQEKWLSARRRLWRRRWMRGREPGVGYWSFKEDPSLFPPSLAPQREPTLEGGRVALAPVRINIISVINIKSALLCFASGSGPKAARGPCTDRRPFPSFLSTPPSLAIYWDHNLLWWVFRVLFCQGQSGLSNKWSWWSGGGLAPATPPSRSVSDTRGQIHFWKFRINCFRPWLREERKKRRRGEEEIKKGGWPARTSGCQG